MAGGTNGLTVKLWDHIERNPGLTIDELVYAAKEGGMVPPSANREYAHHLNVVARPAWPAGRSAGQAGHEPWTVDRDKAARYIVVRTLKKMRDCGSIRRDDNDRHYTVRPVRRTGSGAFVQPPEVVRADVAQREARIAFGRYLAKHPDGQSYMSKPLFRALLSWYEATIREYDEAQAERNAAGLV